MDIEVDALAEELYCEECGSTPAEPIAGPPGAHPKFVILCARCAGREDA